MSPATARLRGGAMLTGIAIALAALPSSPAAAQTASCANADVPFSAATRQKVEDAIVCLTNRERQAAGLPVLVKSQALHNAAAGHSRDMAKRKYFGHAAQAQGNGENIAYGNRLTARQVVDLWMNSAPHRANILRRSFHEIGVGAAAGSPEGPDSPGDGTFTEAFAAR